MRDRVIFIFLCFMLSLRAEATDYTSMIHDAKQASANCTGYEVDDANIKRRTDESIRCGVDAFAPLIDIRFQRYYQKNFHKTKDHDFVLLRFVIEPSGDVSVHLKENKLSGDSDSFAEDLVSILSAMKFPNFDGAQWDGDYPINFFN